MRQDLTGIDDPHRLSVDKQISKQHQSGLVYQISEYGNALVRSSVSKIFSSFYLNEVRRSHVICSVYYLRHFFSQVCCMLLL